jgi:hypothetical protein
MKLPEDKKERNQILVLILMGIGGVIFLAHLGLTSYYNNKKLRLEQIAKLEEDRRMAELDIATSSVNREKNFEIITSIKTITDTHILTPRLGEIYRLSARDIIDRHATSLGLTLETVNEIGKVDVPKKRGANTFMAYTARVDLMCGYHDLLALFSLIEKSNPYLCISAISITANPNNKEKHKASFNVQWPVWADRELSDSLASQLAEAKELQKARLKDVKPETNNSEGNNAEITPAPKAQNKKGGWKKK